MGSRTAAELDSAGDDFESRMLSRLLAVGWPMSSATDAIQELKKGNIAESLRAVASTNPAIAMMLAGLEAGARGGVGFLQAEQAAPPGRRREILSGVRNALTLSSAPPSESAEPKDEAPAADPEKAEPDEVVWEERWGRQK